MPILPISSLPVATTPLAGTEQAAVVQGGVTKRVAASALGAPVITTSAVADGVPTAVATALVDSYASVVWEVTLFTATGERQQWCVCAYHDGYAGADATTANYTIFGPGPNSPAHDITVDVTGSGAGQTMRLVITAAAAGWSAGVQRVVAHSAGAA